MYYDAMHDQFKSFYSTGLVQICGGLQRKVDLLMDSEASQCFSDWKYFARVDTNENRFILGVAGKLLEVP